MLPVGVPRNTLTCTSDGAPPTERSVIRLGSPLSTFRNFEVGAWWEGKVHGSKTCSWVRSLWSLNPWWTFYDIQQRENISIVLKIIMFIILKSNLIIFISKIWVFYMLVYAFHFTLKDFLTTNKSFYNQYYNTNTSTAKLNF